MRSLAIIIRRKKEKTWVTAEILDQRNRRRDLRKKRFEHEGSEKYKEMNEDIKRCMEKAKEQCSETEENLRETTVRERVNS